MSKKKLIIFLVILFLFIISVIFLKKNDVKQDVTKGSNIEKTKKQDLLQVDFQYSPNMNILSSGNDIVIYDGKRLLKKNDKLKDLFSVRIVASDYITKTIEDDIYILDRSQKIIYKINKDGHITAQVKYTQNARNIYPLKNGDLILSYNTNVGTDGIIIYDKNMVQKNNIDYPNALVNTIAYEEVSGNIIVSVQMLDNTQILNAIYYYNSKYEVQSISQYKNLITLQLLATHSSRYILDPTRLYILDNKNQSIGVIDAQKSFEKMTVSRDRIYVLDGSKNVKIHDIKGVLLEEKSFKEQINNIIDTNNKIIYVGQNTIYLPKEETITLAKDIEESLILKNNKLVLFLKGNINIYQVEF